MSQPVEIDIAVGIGGERAAFHLETFAKVSPYEFVAAMQECAHELLSAPQDAQVSPQVGEETGSVPVERKAAAGRSRPAAADPPKVTKFDPDAARRRAAEAS